MLDKKKLKRARKSLSYVLRHHPDLRWSLVKPYENPTVDPFLYTGYLRFLQLTSTA